MQQPHIKLKEVIWEITDNCYNGCTYCGSKDILNQTEIEEAKIKHIISELKAYPPEELNISGGDPLTVLQSVHRYLLDELTPHMQVKILVNPVSITTSKYEILAAYDWVGISINTMGELNLLIDRWDDLSAIHNKCTIITNFNCENVWVYQMFENFVKGANLTWQIQYTMYRGDHDHAIYQKPLAIGFLHKEITKSQNAGVKVVLADNLNEGSCSAGLYSCGILCNGEVVPCLSMRSWADSNMLGWGNLFLTSLSVIWENNLGNFRCNPFKCCKDICNAPFKKQVLQLSDLGVKLNQLPQLDPPNTMMLYGVSQYPEPNPYDRTYVYGVYNREYPIAMAYGVSTTDDVDWTQFRDQSAKPFVSGFGQISSKWDQT